MSTHGVADEPSGLAAAQVDARLEARIAAVNGEPGPDVASFDSAVVGHRRHTVVG